MAPQAAATLSLADWRWLEVRSGIVTIEAATVDKFVPQMVNFELVGGVDFQKGCYPGQEVVARSQYRGTTKRRTFLSTAMRWPAPARTCSSPAPRASRPAPSPTRRRPLPVAAALWSSCAWPRSATASCASAAPTAGAASRRPALSGRGRRRSCRLSFGVAPQSMRELFVYYRVDAAKRRCGTPRGAGDA
jgi:folate-binding protein YgfZ